MHHMSISMNRVWFVFFATFMVAVEADGFFQQRAPTEKVPKTKYSLIFGSSAIRHIIENNGYGYENYSVTTEDGYILNVNRIIHPNRTGSDRGYPLLLVNGFFMQSEAWLVQSRLDSNIALVFANQGYDVWMGDQRGTLRSKRHVNLTTDDEEFWNYSFHETGIYDMPAFVDLVLKETNSKDLIFSCMSLGCSFHAVLASKRPSYNQKIRAAIYFVPLVNNIRRIRDMISSMYIWFRFQPLSVDIYEKAGALDWFPFLGSLKKEIYHICRPTPSLHVLAPRFVYGSAFHIPTEAVCFMAVTSLGGANVKSTRHILQVYETGDFAEYDYGREENKKRYGTEWAPLYDMKQITSHIAIYYSDADVFASPAGVEKTIKSISGPTYSCKLPNFNHLDVAAGTNFRFVLPDVVDLLSSLTGKNHTEKFKSGKCPSMEWIRHLQ